MVSRAADADDAPGLLRGSVREIARHQRSPDLRTAWAEEQAMPVIAERPGALEFGLAAALRVGGVQRRRDLRIEKAVVLGVDPQHRRRRATRQLAGCGGQQIR